MIVYICMYNTFLKMFTKYQGMSGNVRSTKLSQIKQAQTIQPLTSLPDTRLPQN